MIFDDINKIALAVFAALFLITIGVEELRIHNWRQDYKDQTAALEICDANLNTANANISTLKGAVDQANAQWKALQIEQKANEAAAQARANAAIANGKTRATMNGSGPNAMNDWMKKEFSHAK